MKYERTKHLKPAEFKRFWGVQLETFKQSEIPLSKTIECFADKGY
jgi:hypothetical protein